MRSSWRLTWRSACAPGLYTLCAAHTGGVLAWRHWRRAAKCVPAAAVRLDLNPSSPPTCMPQPLWCPGGPGAGSLRGWMAAQVEAPAPLPTPPGGGAWAHDPASDPYGATGARQASAAAAPATHGGVGPGVGVQCRGGGRVGGEPTGSVDCRRRVCPQLAAAAPFSPHAARKMMPHLRTELWSQPTSRSCAASAVICLESGIPRALLAAKQGARSHPWGHRMGQVCRPGGWLGCRVSQGLCDMTVPAHFVYIPCTLLLLQRGGGLWRRAAPSMRPHCSQCSA